jgi:hypothetical protein
MKNTVPALIPDPSEAENIPAQLTSARGSAYPDFIPVDAGCTYYGIYVFTVLTDLKLYDDTFLPFIQSSY